MSQPYIQNYKLWERPSAIWTIRRMLDNGLKPDPNAYARYIENRPSEDIFREFRHGIPYSMSQLRLIFLEYSKLPDNRYGQQAAALALELCMKTSKTRAQHLIQNFLDKNYYRTGTVLKQHPVFMGLYASKKLAQTAEYLILFGGCCDKDADQKQFCTSIRRQISESRPDIRKMAGIVADLLTRYQFVERLIKSEGEDELWI